jgi:hypothetical protein
MRFVGAVASVCEVCRLRHAAYAQRSLLHNSQIKRMHALLSKVCLADEECGIYALQTQCVCHNKNL